MEEDFQTVPLDNEHWDMEEIPDGTFMCSQTCLTTWTMSIPMSICELPNIIVLQHTGYVVSQN